MKQLRLFACLLILAAARVQAATPALLEPLRTAIDQQLAAATSSVPVDKKLVAALKRTLVAIDKPTVNTTVKETQVLSLVVQTLSRTSIAGQFSDVLGQTVQDYQQALSDWADTSGQTLADTPASSVHNSAQGSLDACRALLDRADAAPDLITASKLLAQAATKLTATDRLISRAAKAHGRPPLVGATGITAQMSGDINWDFKSSEATVVSTNASIASGILVAGAQQTGGSPRAIVLLLNGLQAGINELTHGVGLGPTTLAVVTEEVNRVTTTWASQSGSAEVKYDPEKHTVSGTFNFECINTSDHSRLMTMTGKFAGTVK